MPTLVRPHFAQGDGDVWTVTSLADPGDGTCDDVCTLREAIAAATSGGTIAFAGGLTGSILLTDGQLEIIDKNLSIDGANRITVDAQGNSRVLLIEDAATSGTMAVRLTGLVLTNGTTTGDPDSDKTLAGAGIRALGADLTLNRVTVSNSLTPANAGGIYLADGAALSMDHSTVSGNESSLGNGGGIFANDAAVEMTNSTISDNTARDGGGGLFNFGGASTIAGSTISENESDAGGGIVQLGGSLLMARSTVSGNTAMASALGTFTGGGMTLAGQAVVELRSVTITGNIGVGGMGGQSLAAGGQVNLTISNSIIGGGGSGPGVGCLYDLGATVVSGGYNVLSADCATAAPAATDILVQNAVMYTQVLEAELKDNGGPTRTHALFKTGLAVDAGFCPSESTDQRDLARRVDVAEKANVADACDIGAYELQAQSTALADLIVSQTVDRTSVKQGDLLTYTVRVRNLGPQAAGNVVVSTVLSSGVTFVEARPSKGSATAPPKGETGTVTWSVGDMENGDNETAEIAVTVLVKGKTTITTVATATADTTDPVEGNNSASITVSVGAGGSTTGKGGPKK